MNRKSDQSNVNTHFLKGLFSNIRSSNEPHKESIINIVYVLTLNNTQQTIIKYGKFSGVK